MKKSINFPQDRYYDDQPFEGTAKDLLDIILRDNTRNVEILLAESIRDTKIGSYGIFQCPVDGGRVNMSLWFNGDGQGGGTPEEMVPKPRITLDQDTKIVAVIHSNQS